jgi:hypothetical protein
MEYLAICYKTIMENNQPTQPLLERNSVYVRAGLILLILGLAVNFFLMPFDISGDGEIRFKFMDILVHQGKITPMVYSIVGPIFSLPLWWLSNILNNPKDIVIRYNFILYVIFLIVWYYWLRNRFDRKFILTFFFLLSFGSMFPGHLLRYYGEVFTALCLMTGTTAIALKKYSVGWVFLFLAVLNTPPLLVAFSFLVLYAVWRTRKLRYLVLIPACALLLFLEAYFRTGGLLSGFQVYLTENHGFKTILPYSGKIGYSYPFGFGVLSVLFSFGKGLLLYCPGILLVSLAWKYITNPAEKQMIISWYLIVAGLIAAYSSWWAWYGGDYWGPRFFLFTSIPATWILAKLIHFQPRTLPKTILLSFFVVWSLWVGLNGVVFQQKTLDVCFRNDYAMEYLCWYIPEFSPLFKPFITHATFHLNDRLLLLLNAGIWLFVALPLGYSLLRPLRSFAGNALASFRKIQWRV